MKRKCLFVALLLIVFSAMLATVAFADDHGSVIDSGTCGDQLRWTLYEDGLLDIDGEGEMYDYQWYYTETEAPWKKYADSVTSLRLSDSITSIGDSAFASMENISSELILPRSLVRIGTEAFYCCTSMAGQIIIPETCTSIEQYAFYDCGNLSGNLTIPDSVTTLGEGAFHMCTGLDGTLILCAKLTKVPMYAFRGCSFTGNLCIPEGIEEIGCSAFYDCDFDGILSLPESLVTIGDYAFMYCEHSTPELTIPENVKSIGNYAFSYFGGYHNLRVVFFAGDAPDCISYWGNDTKWDSVFDGASDDFTVYYLEGKAGWTTPTWNGYSCCPIDDKFIYVSGVSLDKKSELIDIKVQSDGSEKKSILKLNASIEPKNATDKSITWSVSDPSILSMIEPGVFQAESIGTAVVTVKSNIGSYIATCEVSVALSGRCGDNLTWALYPEGLLKINGSGSMWDYENESSDNNTAKTSPWAEYENRITSLSLEKGITHIGDYAFYGLYSLASNLMIPEGLVSIGNSSFSECRQLSGSLVLPKSLKTIGNGAFSNCVNLSGDLVLPDSLQEIGDYAFIACSGFEKLVLPSQVQRIGERAFMDCTGLSGDLLIPESVKQIGDWAFFECVKLRNVYFAGDAPIVGDALVGRWNGEIEATFYYEQGKTGYSYPVWRGFPCWPTDHIEAVGYEPSIQVEGISFVPEEIELKVGETAQLNMVFTPKGATDEYLTWFSTEDAIVSVKDGVVTAVDEGSARIFVISSHNGRTTFCRVKVTADQKEHAPYSVYPLIQPKATTNINEQNYAYDNWAKPIKSYLFENQTGGLTRVEYSDGKIIIEDYSDSFIAQASHSITMELPIWGGFYAGERYYFVIFGQENRSEDNQKEVVRVVKYSKDWKRLGAASLCGANTVCPFDAGTLRCVEAEGALYIRTSHAMYKTGDGANHQASLSFMIREKDMQITDAEYAIAWDTAGYVSHSFNQFLIEDTEHKLVALDHGDGYPRSIILMRYKDMLAGDPQAESGTENTEILTFPGNTGDNHTGASVGGFAATSKGYVTAYNFDGTATHQKRDMYLAFTDQNSFETSRVKLTSGRDTSTPVLAVRDKEGGFILWNEKNSSGGYEKTVYYAEYDRNGKVGTIKSVSAALSDCQPILYNGQLIWYVTDKSAPVFYTLDNSGLKKAIPKLRGDVNEDGTVDATDRMILARYLAKWDGYEAKIKSMDAADIDRDGNVTAKDRMILARYLAKWTGYDQYFK